MKAKEIREMTDDELENLERETRRELFNLRMQQTTGQLENPARVRVVRREMARIRTLINERGRMAS